MPRFLSVKDVRLSYQIEPADPFEIKGSVSFDDPETEREYINRIKRRIGEGDTTAWFNLTLETTLRTGSHIELTHKDTIFQVTISEDETVEESRIFKDMTNEALDWMERQIKIFFEKFHERIKNAEHMDKGK